MATKRNYVSLYSKAATRVKYVRLRHKLTQPELAALLGVCVNTVNNWERDRKLPSRLARIRLAEYEQGKLRKPVKIVWTW